LRSSLRLGTAWLALVGGGLSGCGGGGSAAPPVAPGSDAGVEAGVALTACTVTQGSQGLLLRGRLLLPAGPTTGELLVDTTGKIACADASCMSAPGYAAATIFDCPSAVISPSLIDSHDHTDYASVGPVAHGTIRYQHRNDWRTGAEGATPLRYGSGTGDPNVLAAQELRMVLGGATAILGSGGIQGFARNFGGTTAELEGLTGANVTFDTFPLGDENGTLLTSGCAYPYIEPAKAAFAYGPYAPHISEGINLAGENEFACASVASNDLVTSKTELIHGVAFNAKDVDVVRRAGTTVVWSPRSNVSLYGNTAPVTELRNAGVPIALGTDWLPSGSMNPLREFACADFLNRNYFAGAFTDEDLWLMATKNGAGVAGFGSQMGTLAAGMVADIAVFDATVNQDYRAVIAASVEDVHLVLRGGKPLYGDTALVGTLAQGCSPLDVCGNDRQVCVDVPGVTLAGIQGAAANIYPLFFCAGATPDGEPSCTPYRDTYPNGIATGDQDGDGVPDGTDDCPTIFNPPRPMDGTAQADVDGDGVGDACDAAPLDPTKH
jgi:Amidohydrolase family